MSNRIRAVSLAMLSTGCFKVVKDGITYFPISTPSKPVREISSGTLYPASDNAFPAPIASISEIAKIAVHGICFSRNPINNDASGLEALEKLAKLHEQGILTDDEFQQKKSDLLAKI